MNLDYKDKNNIIINIDPEGNVDLMMPESTSIIQEDTFIKLVTVISSPSVVLRFVIFLELFLLRIKFFLESFFIKNN